MNFEKEPDEVPYEQDWSHHGSQFRSEPPESDDNELDEPDEPAEFSSRRAANATWSECVSIAHHNGRFHHKTSPRTRRRFLGGRGNRLFKEAEKVWRRLPEKIVAKEEKRRIELKKIKDRFRNQRYTSLKKQEKQARMQALAIEAACAYSSMLHGEEWLSA